jgi:hypothetical protein
VTVVVGVVAFLISFLQSPVMTWTNERYNRSTRIGGDEHGRGGDWTHAGTEAMKWWWAGAASWGLILAAFAVLFLATAVNRNIGYY